MKKIKLGKHKIFKFRDQSGLGLVEVIAALGLSVVVLTSLVSLSIMSLRSSLESKLMLEGTKLAEREVELVRALRDSATVWTNGSTGFIDRILACDTSDCYVNTSGGLSVTSGSRASYGSGSEVVEYYFRATKVTGGNLAATDTEVRITATAEWDVGTKTKTTSIYTDLTNWENK